MAIQKISYKNNVILHVDYRGMNEQSMIAQVDAVLKIVKEAGTPHLILSEYNTKNYASPKFVSKLQSATIEILPLVKKSAIVKNLNPVQKLILKGYNYLLRRNIKAFNSREEALEYLVNEHTTDYDVPEYLRVL